VFSIEHPIFMAPRQPGWLTDGQGRKTWPVDSYQQARPARLRLAGARRGQAAPHPGHDHQCLAASGFQLDHVEEWGPTDAQVAQQPALAEERERPMLLLIGCRLP
jgi:hypothetical protein